MTLLTHLLRARYWERLLWQPLDHMTDFVSSQHSPPCFPASITSLHFLSEFDKIPSEQTCKTCLWPAGFVQTTDGGEYLSNQKSCFITSSHQADTLCSVLFARVLRNGLKMTICKDFSPWFFPPHLCHFLSGERTWQKYGQHASDCTAAQTSWIQC